MLVLGLALAGAAEFQTLERGLELAVFDAPQASTHGDSKITVLRIDPAHFELALGQRGDAPTKTAKEHVDAHGWVAAINPSMYLTDHRTSVFEMRSPEGVNQAKRHANAGHWLAFGPKDPSLPAVQLIDRGCDGTAAIEHYETVIQSYRLLTCTGSIPWAKNQKRWSHAVVGIDGKGRILFIHCRSPYNTGVFVGMLKTLPIDLKRLMYAEGGPEATLVVQAGGTELELFGSYETGFKENDLNAHAWHIPNALGVKRRLQQPAAPGTPQASPSR